MIWYIGLLIVAVAVIPLGVLLALRASSQPIEFTAEQIKRIHARNIQQDGIDERER